MPSSDYCWHSRTATGGDPQEELYPLWKRSCSCCYPPPAAAPRGRSVQNSTGRLDPFPSTPSVPNKTSPTPPSARRMRFSSGWFVNSINSVPKSERSERMFSTPRCDPGQVMCLMAQSGTSSNDDTPRGTQSMIRPTCNYVTSPMGASKDFPMKPKLLNRKRNGSPNVHDILRTYSLPPTSEL